MNAKSAKIQVKPVRKPGHYWVRFYEDNCADVTHKEWVPARWDGRNWWIIGNSSPSQIDEGTNIRLVGDQILPPNRMARVEKFKTIEEEREEERRKLLRSVGWSGRKESQ